jgi:hypothetical protein
MAPVEAADRRQSAGVCKVRRALIARPGGQDKDTVPLPHPMAAGTLSAPARVYSGAFTK